MSRYPDEQPETTDGWTRWVQPAQGYKMACCDCGLVHQMEFRTAEDGLPEFRVRRDNRATGQIRRRMIAHGDLERPK